MIKKLLFVILFAAVLGLPGVMAQQIKAVSFNIHNNRSASDDGPNSWYLRRKAVMSFITKESPDVMGVQDALLDQTSYIDNYFRKKYRRISVGADNGITRGAHNAIYYDTAKVELIWHTTRWLSRSPRQTSACWDDPMRHTVTIALFRDKQTNKRFYFFNTCLSETQYYAHYESIKLLSDLVEDYCKSGTPVILAGTFNVSDNDPLLEPITGIGMVSGRRIAIRTDFRNTYNAFGKGERSMIDHFFTRNIAIDQFRTVNRNYGASYISDHYPIVIIFSL